MEYQQRGFLKCRYIFDYARNQRLSRARQSDYNRIIIHIDTNKELASQGQAFFFQQNKKKFCHVVKIL